MTEIGRRSFLTGLVALVAAPAIVRVANIMPVKVMEPIQDAVTYQRGLTYALDLRVGDIIRSDGRNFIITAVSQSSSPAGLWYNAQSKIVTYPLGGFDPGDVALVGKRLSADRVVAA
jgi:hypothetical protein